MGSFFFGDAGDSIGDSLGILGCVPAVPAAVGPSGSVLKRGGDRVRAGEPAAGVVGDLSLMSPHLQSLEECPLQLPSLTALQRHPIR